MRGEDKVFCRQPLADKGSPPHARGRLVARHCHAQGRRITPACAGKTLRCVLGLARRMDHPRMRGEDVDGG